MTERDLAALSLVVVALAVGWFVMWRVVLRKIPIIRVMLDLPELPPPGEVAAPVGGCLSRASSLPSLAPFATSTWAPWHRWASGAAWRAVQPFR